MILNVKNGPGIEIDKENRLYIQDKRIIELPKMTAKTIVIPKPPQEWDALKAVFWNPELNECLAEHTYFVLLKRKDEMQLHVLPETTTNWDGIEINNWTKLTVYSTTTGKYGYEYAATETYEYDFIYNYYADSGMHHSKKYSGFPNYESHSFGSKYEGEEFTEELYTNIYDFYGNPEFGQHGIKMDLVIPKKKEGGGLLSSFAYGSINKNGEQIVKENCIVTGAAQIKNNYLYMITRMPDNKYGEFEWNKYNYKIKFFYYDGNMMYLSCTDYYNGSHKIVSHPNAMYIRAVIEPVIEGKEIQPIAYYNMEEVT